MSDADQRYNISVTPDVIRIDGEDRVPVRVRCTDFGFIVRADEEDVLKSNSRATQDIELIGLYEYRKLISTVADITMQHWTSPKADTPSFPDMYNWVKKQTRGALSARLYEPWENHLNRVPVTVREVQKKVFAATMSSAPLTQTSKFYEYEYLVQDVTNYPAAAIAVSSYSQLYSNHMRLGNMDGIKNEERNCPGNAVHYPTVLPEDVDDIDHISEKAITAALNSVCYWLDLFSPTGASYTSLNKTLMNLPGSIPPRLLPILSFVTLPRPFTDRLELLTLLTWLDRVIKGHRRERIHEDIILNAQRADILRAMQRVSEYRDSKLSPRKTKDIQTAVSLMLDYPDAHYGNISGLARRSINWHRETAVEEDNGQYDPSKDVAKPPISLPENDQVQFLDTIGKIIDEGKRMKHCVGSLTPSAVKGLYYLFHAEHQGEQATILVNSNGNVVEAQGPSNTHNKAVGWGSRYLREWGKEL